MSDFPDLSWLKLGGQIYVGPSEAAKYADAAAVAEIGMRWDEAGPDWPSGTVKGTRVR